MPVPANSGAQAGKPAPDLNSNPGIRRPRWGGVVEGVAGQIRHPLAHEGAFKGDDLDDDLDGDLDNDLRGGGGDGD